MRKIAAITLTLLCIAAFAQEKGTFTDPRDKKAYKTAKIGELTWLAENLTFKTKGSICPGEDLDIQTECAKYEKKECSYVDVEIGCSCLAYKKPTAKQIQDKNKEAQANCVKLGRLYERETAKTACPSGWHLPNQKEWRYLEKTAEGWKKLQSTSGWDGTFTGGGTDDYGFTALPRGASWFSSDGGSYKIDGSGFSSKSGLEFIRCVQGTLAEAEAIIVAKEKAEAEKKEVEKEAAEKTAVENAVGKQFNPKIKYGSFTDSRDKATYKTVKIGNQTWMAENLKFNASGSKCYEDKDYYCKRDGRLYDLKTSKTACPSGWHLPTDGEWTTLGDAVGGSKVAATKLTASSGWWRKVVTKTEPINSGADDFGFSALPSINNVIDDGSSGKWWTASTPKIKGYNGNVAEIYYIRDWEFRIHEDYNGTLRGIRCVQGEAPKEEPAPAQPAKSTQPAAKEQQKQPPVNEFCSITFPKKTCLEMPKGACKLSGGKVVDKCP